MLITIYPLKVSIKPTNNGFRVTIVELVSRTNSAHILFDGGYENIGKFINALDKQIAKDRIFATIDIFDKKETKPIDDAESMSKIPVALLNNPFLRGPDNSISCETKNSMLKYLKDHFFADIALSNIFSESENIPE